MSLVTNIMISDDSLSNYMLKNIIEEKLNVIMVNVESVGGSKCLENNLYLGAFNYLILDEFIKSMREVYKDVKVDDDVQLFVKEQDECKWKEVEWRKV